MVFLDEEFDFLLVRIHSYSSYQSEKEVRINENIVFEYCKGYRLDNIQTLELIIGIEGVVSGYKSSSSKIQN